MARIKPPQYKSGTYRKAGQALDPAALKKVHDDAFIAAHDAFGDRYDIVDDGVTISLGAKKDMPGLSPQQYAISQILKEHAVKTGHEFDRAHNLTPDYVHAALLAGAQHGVFGKPAISKIIGGGGVDINSWADPVIQRKFAETGQEMASGIDSVTGGYLASDDYDMGHIYAGNAYKNKKSFPRNTRVESKHENRAYQADEGDALLGRVERRLDKTAISLGKALSNLQQRQAIAEASKTKGGKVQRAKLNRAYSELGQTRVEELQDMIAKQSILERVPPELQEQVMLELGMATSDQLR